MTDSSQPTLLVTGAGGQLGRSAVERLLETYTGRLIATTRSPEKLAALLEKGVDVRHADFDDPATLEAAFAGADRMLLISTGALDTPYRRLTQHRNAVRAAEAAGVQHVVYTSSVAPTPTPKSSLIDDHYWTEHALGTTAFDWTILRNSLYTDFLLMGLPQALATGQLHTATGGGARNYVTRDDCARSAVGALVSATGRSIHHITGPAPLTQNELAAIVSELTGRSVAHVPVPPDALREGMVGVGVPPFMADALVAFDVAAAEGYHALRTSSVETLSGRAPTSVREFLTANLDALSPNG